MAIHTHTLNENNNDHIDFLLEERKDLVTREEFKLGDTVVICARCQAFHLLGSWQDMGDVCLNNNCRCQDTLDYIPKQEKVFFREPTIEYFYANSENVYPGDQIEFSWKVREFDTISIGNLEVTTLNNYVFEIEEESVFTLGATNSKGSVQQELVLNILAPRINFFTASRRQIVENVPIRLTWDVHGATELVLQSNLGEESVVHTDFIDVQPEQEVIYTLVARNSIGEVTSDVELELVPINIISFEVDKNRVNQGELVNLSWEVEHAETVFINNGIGKVLAKGQRSFVVGENDVIVNLKAIGPYNTNKEENRLIEVAAITNIQSEQVGNNQYRILWDANYFEQSYIEDEQQEIIKGRKIPSGQFCAYIPRFKVNKNFKIIGESRDGNKIEIPKLFKVPKIRDFQADSPIVFPNMPLELSWNVEDATRIEISHGIGEVASTGNLSLNISKGQNRFIIKAYGDIGHEEKELELRYFEIPTLREVNITAPNNLYKFKPETTVSIFDLVNKLNLNQIKIPQLNFNNRKYFKIIREINLLKIKKAIKLSRLSFPSLTNLFLQIKQLAAKAI